MGAFALSKDQAYAQAKRILTQRSVRVGGPFTLASGAQSNFYVDVRQTALDPEGMDALAVLMADAVSELEFDGVGGPTLGADPLTTGLSLALWHTGRRAPAFIVRKEAKGHGTGNWVEGAPALGPGSKVILLEDVVTTGGSSLKAAEKLQALDWEIVSFVCVVDRQEGAAQRIEEAGYSLRSLFTKSDFL